MSVVYAEVAKNRSPGPEPSGFLGREADIDQAVLTKAATPLVDHFAVYDRNLIPSQCRDSMLLAD